MTLVYKLSGMVQLVHLFPMFEVYHPSPPGKKRVHSTRTCVLPGANPRICCLHCKLLSTASLVENMTVRVTLEHMAKLDVAIVIQTGKSFLLSSGMATFTTLSKFFFQ